LQQNEKKSKSAGAANGRPQQKKPAQQQKSAPPKTSTITAKQTKAQKQRGRPRQKQDPLKVAFLGGINEVGKNITVYEYKGERIAVDCGLAFPDAQTPGIDLIIPDFSWLEHNHDILKGIVITHGHEDHIGALPYLLKRINVPVYATKLTLGLIRGKLKEHRMLDRVKLNEIKPRDTIALGGFTVEAIHVNHSIPDAVAFAVTCGAGTVIQTGDFKIDTTPIDGDMFD